MSYSPHIIARTMDTCKDTNSMYILGYKLLFGIIKPNLGFRFRVYKMQFTVLDLGFSLELSFY